MKAEELKCCPLCGEKPSSQGKALDVEATVRAIAHKALDINNLVQNEELLKNFPMTIAEIMQARDEIAEEVAKQSSPRGLRLPELSEIEKIIEEGFGLLPSTGYIFEQTQLKIKHTARLILDEIKSLNAPTTKEKL